jgi:asparagine N-glycosylation enzyme membrane subunit Stt3
MVLSKAGYMYRHNDYLNIARDLGLPFLTIILVGIYKILRKTKIDYLFVAILVLAVSSMTWTSMYFARLAVMGIVMLAVKELENVRISNLRNLL